MRFYATSDITLGVVDPETGDKDEVLIFYVAGETPEGRRFYHNATFRAEAQAEKLAARIQKACDEGAGLDERYWIEGDPAYGSAAYQKLDARGHFAAREIMEAADAGEIGYDEADRLCVRHGLELVY